MGWSELGDSIKPLNANGEILSICTDATGNVYAAGNFKDSAGFYYVAKCAKIDQVKWIRLNSNTSNKLNSVHFPNSHTDYAAGQGANTGYAAGEGGIILKTTNCGANWTTLNSGTSNSLYSLYFSNTADGYAVGESGTIVKTTNGGTNWTALSSGTTNQLNAVHFTDTANGYAIGAGGTILKTINGGTKWVSQSSGTLNSLNSVYFTNANTGYVVGASGKIIKTTDGGAAWLASASVRRRPRRPARRRPACTPRSWPGTRPP